MSRKKHSDEERKPDLAVPDQEELEAKVREMLDIEVDEKPKESEQATERNKSEDEIAEEVQESVEAKKVDVQEVSSAPELPADEKVVEPEKPESSESSDVDSETDDEVAEEKVLNLDEAPTEKAILDEPILEEEEVKQEDEKPQSPSEDQLEKSRLDPVIEDEKTGKAVDDILAKEADALLEAEDEKPKTVDEPKKSGLKQKLTSFFKAWWNNPKARYGTLVGVILLLVISFVVPTSRYFILNTFGVRASVSIMVLDESTGQPLKNVEVTIANVSTKTDSNGQANTSSVRLGSTNLVVKKLAFAESTQKVTVKTGNNAFADVRLKPTGEQYSFVVTDFLTKKPLQKVEAVSGEASAFSDEQGRIKITVAEVQDNQNLKVSFKKNDFREDNIEIDPQDKSEQPVVMVAGRKHLFVSKRTGKYDLYSVYVDGKEETKVLEGTGSERDDVAIAIHPTSSVAAVVSTRSGKTNSGGFLLSSLTVVDEAGKSNEATSSERVQLIGWINDDLIYVQAKSGASASNPNRHRLMSYNYKTKQNKELATTNYFNDVVIAAGKIYFAPSSSYKPEDAKLYKVNADGSQKETIVNQEIWNIFRSDYENLMLSANQTWLNVRIGEQKATSITTPPTNPISRTYIDTKDGKNSLWVDQRDGKGVLINYEVSSKNESTLKNESGVSYPVYWLNNRTVIYRISHQQETADYVMSIDGGDSHKIGDVTNTNSVDNWYYY